MSTQKPLSFQINGHWDVRFWDSFGVAFGVSLNNMGSIAIGMAIGAGMDKKAREEGRYLDLEVKY